MVYDMITEYYCKHMFKNGPWDILNWVCRTLLLGTGSDTSLGSGLPQLWSTGTPWETKTGMQVVRQRMRVSAGHPGEIISEMGSMDGSLSPCSFVAVRRPNIF